LPPDAAKPKQVKPMITILCVEDEDDIRNLLVEEISEAGFTALEASNGKRALELIISKWPDIVVCDITMPEMNGISCSPRYR
jgi:CheY-like chemotaxis protein